MTTSSVNQLYVCIASISILGIVSASMILHRLICGRAWFLKLWYVSGGTFVIPNAVFAFLGCQACFGFNWIIYAFVTIRHYQVHTFQATYFVYKPLTFCPLWVGGWWTAFGIAGAFPDALTLKVKGSKQKRLIVSPLVFNIACWGGPAVQVCSLLAPAFPAVRKNISASSDFGVWREDVQAALQGSAEGASYDELRARALKIWLQISQAYWYYSVVMLCWCGWGIVSLIAHVPMGGHVLLRIRRQLKIEKRKIQVASNRPTAVSLEFGTIDASDSKAVQEQKDHFCTATSRVFPPLKESPTTRRKSKQINRTPEERRLRNLRRLLINLEVQYFGIALAVMFFITGAGIDAFQIYDAARHNYIMRVEEQSNLFAAWSMVLFASLIFWCIFQRSFDPSLSIDLSDEEPSPIAPRSTLKMLVKPFLCSPSTDQSPQMVTPRVDKDDAASRVSSLQNLCVRKDSEGGTGLDRSSTCVAINSDSEKKSLGWPSQIPTPQTPTLDLSPVSISSKESFADDTIEVYYASPPSAEVTASSGVTVPESPGHDGFHLADPKTHHGAAPRDGGDQEIQIGSSQRKLLGESGPLRQGSMTSLRQRSNTLTHSSRVLPRRPVTGSDATGRFGLASTRWEASLLDTEGKCFDPLGSHVETALGQPQAESKRQTLPGTPEAQTKSSTQVTANLS
ncbi:hypothetical protein EX895_006233 [Sporisorium graminicola]|uniref:Uncharacterized protein n=1 Tax=Sporisorium graminicola TaxID=280036 RepID=A0A4U7KM84_9BASI|nr:hypothetical protein EX895_006233 [Sporisorium graminicola]TKY85153.1 hypothetical protein EX895_006233 [Sporisorium graminicola]